MQANALIYQVDVPDTGIATSLLDRDSPPWDDGTSYLSWYLSGEQLPRVDYN
jgi:hypothetical protein